MLKICWRNIWRNKVRSGVVLGAIALGLFCGTYLSAFITGWMVGTVKEDIETYTSHVQIHHPDFTRNHDLDAYISKDDVHDRLHRFLANRQGNEHYRFSVSSRLNITGMLASAHNAVGLTANGIEVEDEKGVSSVWKTIPDSLGAFLPDDMKNPIVISEKTAKKLKVKPRSKVIFSFQDVSGEMQSMAFRISGIYHTSNTAVDEGNVYVRYADIFPASGLPDGAVHQVAVMVNEPADDPLAVSGEIFPEIKNLFPEYTVEDWQQLNPMLAMSLAMTDIMVIVVLMIFLLALAFGIVNTMLMAILERTRELGMLSAIGMNSGKIFRMVMTETVLLTLAGSFAGIILAAIALLPSIHYGIDLHFMMGDTFEDYGFSSVVFPVVNVKMLAQIIVLVVLAGILSAVYPAGKAIKINTIEAIKSE
ncbi:MAG: FtsX-like permease family protein [Tannerella sp.]|jgi:ABC-type lipoprotein release transport system permease subunit|nr:FtsX-like permease family protein [Tannerella sp.]